MPDPLALFSLEPIDDRARQVVANPCNKQFVSFLATKRGDVAVLDIGHLRSANGDDTLATLGRSGCDILVEGASISKMQCSFELNRETGVIMFYDRSHGQTCQVFAAEDSKKSATSTTPFQHGRVRRVVVQKELNTVIGMGGVGRNLVRFRLIWHSDPLETLETIRARQGNCVPCNPQFARTVDEADTIVPSRMETRIHTPGHGQPRMRWVKRGKAALGAGAFGEVWKALDVDTGRTMAAKVMRRRSDELWETLKREVEILSRVSHVSKQLHSSPGLFVGASHASEMRAKAI